MNDSIYQTVLTGLRETKGSWPHIAAATGVSIRTIQKIASGEIEDPGISHIEKLFIHFTAANVESPEQKSNQARA